MKDWRKIIGMCCLIAVMYSVSAYALIIHLEGLNTDDTVVVNDEIEFVGLAQYLGFDFEEYDDHLLLTMVNIKQCKGLIWLNYGTLTFEGFNTITDMWVYENNKFHGKVVNDFTWDDESISFDFSSGYFEVSDTRDQSLTFWIESDKNPVPEPSSLLLFGAGILFLTRLKKR